MNTASEGVPLRMDAVVIGGGPAGLTAAIYLARFRRSVLLADANQSRMAQIPRSRNYPGFADGIPGTTLLAALREQAQHYAIRTVSASVDTVEPRAGGFDISWAGGRVHARQLLLATGATDVAPRMSFAAEALRAGLLRYCPVCDGYEAIDRVVGVIANSPSGVDEALYLHHFTPHITLFMEEGSGSLAETERCRLTDAGIEWADGLVASVFQRGASIVVAHAGRETVCDALYSALGMKVQSSLAARLGAATDDDGYLVIDRHHGTTVANLYAAGDVARPQPEHGRNGQSRHRYLCDAPELAPPLSGLSIGRPS